MFYDGKWKFCILLRIKKNIFVQDGTKRKSNPANSKKNFQEEYEARDVIVWYLDVLWVLWPCYRESRERGIIWVSHINDIEVCVVKFALETDVKRKDEYVNVLAK